MGIDVDVYYLSTKDFVVHYVNETFTFDGKIYNVPCMFHIYLKHPISFAEFKKTYKEFYYLFYNDNGLTGWVKYEDDKIIRDFWIVSNTYTEVVSRITGKTKLLLPSIRMKKAWLIKYDIMSNYWELGRKKFHYIDNIDIDREIFDVEPDTEYYHIITYN